MPEFAGWRPVKDAHAIHTAGVVITFSEPIGDVLWRRTDASVAEKAKALGLEERQPVGFFLPPPFQGLNLQPPQAEAGASYLKRERPDFFSEQVQTTRDTVKYEQWEYTRWSPFRERARELIADPVARYCDVSSLGTITAYYVDVFQSVAADRSADIGDVVAASSPAVAEIAFRPHSPWHSHSGWFEYPDEFTRRLCLINIDVTDHARPDGGSGLAVQVTTQITEQFSQPGSTALPDGMATWGLVEERLEVLHLQLKELLKATLAPGSASAIALR